LISLEYQDQQHKTFCYEYKNVASLQKTNVWYVVICCWWPTPLGLLIIVWFMSSIIGWAFSTSMLDNGEALICYM